MDAAELSSGELVHEVRDLVEKQDLKLLIIDSLNGFLNAMPGEKFLAMQLHELLAYLSQKGIATLMTVAQHGFVGTNIDTPVDVSYLADTVLLFRYFEAAGEVRQALSVIKKRSGEHERTIRELVMKNGAIIVGYVLDGIRRRVDRRSHLSRRIGLVFQESKLPGAHNSEQMTAR